MRAARAARRSRGVSTFFVLVGALTVLGVTFLLGAMVGRFWPNLPSFRPVSVAKAPRERVREREPRAPEPPPMLTFYRELTAPLTAPPAARPAKPRPDAPKAEAPKEPAHEASRPEPPGAPRPEAPGNLAARFTVQVGAYKTREPAEALRARVAAAGHDAHVVETDGPVRFRVRVGAYATRDAAQAAAARIGADRAFSTFVTAR